ncbi:MAG: AbrB family transcriptional regulator [Nostocaceae cyanobacterium]|nr:AbrB family transcriptional regulator [Nostocaceae cyanobacterium]
MNQIFSVTPSKEDLSYQNPVVGKSQKIFRQLAVLAIEILLTIPLGLAISWFHVGGIAWILGGLVSGTVVLQTLRVLYGYCSPPNRTARKVGLVLVGLTVGIANSPGNLAHVASVVPVFVFLSLFLLVSGGVIGYIYSRFSKINLLTAMLATVPGGLGIMASLAADYGRNVTLVAMVQAIRVTSVVFLIPFIARKSAGNSLNLSAITTDIKLFSFELSYLILLFLALLLCALAVYVAKLLKIPAAPFLATLFVGTGFNPLINSLPFVDHIHFNPPLLLKLIGQMLLGITIGEYWGEKPSFEKKTIVYALISIAMTLTTGAIAALMAMQLTSWDWLTCLLVTAPGGSAEMILVALGLNHNVEIVTAGHLVRLIAINFSLPIWLFLFRHLDSKIDVAD